MGITIIINTRKFMYGWELSPKNAPEIKSTQTLMKTDTKAAKCFYENAQKPFKKKNAPQPSKLVNVVVIHHRRTSWTINLLFGRWINIWESQLHFGPMMEKIHRLTVSRSRVCSPFCLLYSHSQIAMHYRSNAQLMLSFRCVRYQLNDKLNNFRQSNNN